jgi:hypothetical protein
MPSPRISPAGRLRRLAALALVGSLSLAACADDADPAPTPGDKPAKDAVEAPPVSPLTGLPVKGKAPRHPVLAVKVDNSSSSAPQVGLGAADMVVEELVEGGITRLAVFFYSQVPQNVGPVRSMRATDIGILQPLGATLVASGGAPQTTSRVEGAGITTFTEGAAGYYRETSRSAPYNLFMRLPEVARAVRADEAPAPYLPFGDAIPQGRPASRVTASFSGSSSSTFEFRDGGYVNTDTHAGGEDQFLPRTVLVLRVPVGDAGYTDPAGNPVPETKFTGRGPAMVFSGGRVVRGTWVKNGLDAPVQLLAGGGRKLEVPTGKVWVELVPADGGDVTVAP